MSVLVIYITSGFALDNKLAYARSVVQNKSILWEYLLHLTLPDIKIMIFIKKGIEYKKSIESMNYTIDAITLTEKYSGSNAISASYRK